jgi:uncharacterized protein
VKFWDASAVVPLLVAEDGSAALLGLLEDDPSMLVWWATPIECTSALAREERAGRLAATAVSAALERLAVLSEGWNELSPSEPVRSVARRVLRVHPLRAADALQLAAAIVASSHQPSSFEFVCQDQRLADAAAREGFKIRSA